MFLGGARGGGIGGSSTNSNPGETELAIGADGHEDEATAGSARHMGQLVLRLNWAEPGEGGGPEEGGAAGAGYITLIIHGAFGLAKADL